MREPFYRFRNAFWAIWYGAFHVDTFFGVVRGSLLVPEELVQSGDVKHGVRKIPMEWPQPCASRGAAAGENHTYDCPEAQE